MYHIQFIRSYARKKQRLYRKIGMVFKLYADRIVIGFQYPKTKSSLHLCPFHGLNPHVCQVAIRVDIGEHVKVNFGTCSVSERPLACAHKQNLVFDSICLTVSVFAVWHNGVTLFIQITDRNTHLQIRFCGMGGQCGIVSHQDRGITSAITDN